MECSLLFSENSPMRWLPIVPALMVIHPLSMAAPIADFELADARGASHRLVDGEPKAIVVVFLGIDCPLANLYAPRLRELHEEFAPRGVRFIAINSNRHDALTDIARFTKEHRLTFPYVKDPDGSIAGAFQAERTPESFVLDAGRKVRYRGRIDDQYTPGLQRAKVTRRDVAEALSELLAGKAVSVPESPATGCFINRHRDRVGTSLKEPPTYCRDIAPIIQRHCVACHRPGQIAPFSLTSYKKVRDWADTIAEVVEAGRMPPWSADPAHGKFANDPTLSAADKRLIEEWVRQGCHEGDLADLPPPRTFSEGWSIPEPDRVFAIPQPFAVPAEGVIEYQNFEVDPGFTKDVWVTAAEVRPGNRRVVHHCTVFLRAPGVGGDDISESGKLGSFCLTAYAVGTPPLQLPAGMAKRIPAGWKLLFVIHYVSVGTPQEDRTEVGLKFVPADQVRKEVATRLVHDEEIAIPPGAKDHRIEKSWKVEHDLLLLSMFPHMHLRGKSFRYEADYPDGTSETLLNVPAYDFNWQHRYDLAEPKRIPAGTTLRCWALYDNSASNLANPDPTATVRTGRQTWDEMFNGYFEVALADEDLLAERDASVCARWWRLGGIAALVVLMGMIGYRVRAGIAARRI
jgi:peroxiredoxin